jgi:hypothetical protein
MLAAVTVIGLNIWGGAAVLRHYPRAPFMAITETIYLRDAYVSESDGSTTVYKVAHSRNRPQSLYDPCMTRPPRPTSLRIWAPVGLSLVASVFVVGGYAVSRRLSRLPAYTKLLIWASLSPLIWLSSPLFQIAAQPLDDYHAHLRRKRLCYYTTPFRTRYLSLLLHDDRSCGCADNDGSMPTIKNKEHSYYDFSEP